MSLADPTQSRRRQYLAGCCITKRVRQLSQIATQRSSKSKETLQQRGREDLESSDGFEDDEVALVALHEPLCAPERVLTELVEALVDLREGNWMVKMNPNM